MLPFVAMLLVLRDMCILWTVMLLLISAAGAQTIEASPVHAEQIEQGAIAQNSDDTSTYVLWDVTPLGLGADVARSIDEMLLGELRRILGARLIETEPYVDAETRRHVDICGASTGCLAQVAGALGADRLITGTAATIGDAYGLNLKLVDARRGNDLARAETSLTGQHGEMLEGIHRLILELVAPTLLNGALAIEAELSGANIYLDGKLVGTTPMSSPIEGLTAGEHALKISSPLMEDYFQLVGIHHGKTTHVVVDSRQIEALKAKLAAATHLEPLHTRWWFWPAIGGALAVVGGATAYAIWGGAETTTVPPEGSLGYVDVR